MTCKTVWRFSPYAEKIRETFEKELTFDQKTNKRIRLEEKRKLVLAFAKASFNHVLWRRKTMKILDGYTDIIVDMDGTLYRENTFKRMLNTLFRSSIAAEIFAEYQKESKVAFTIEHIKIVNLFRSHCNNGWIDDIINSVKEFNVPLLRFLENEIKRGIKVHLSTLNIIEIAEKMAERIGLDFHSIHGSGEEIISIVPITITLGGKRIKTITKADVSVDRAILITDTSFDIYAMARFPTIFIENNHDMFNTKILKPYLYTLKFGEGRIIQ